MEKEKASKLIELLTPIQNELIKEIEQNKYDYSNKSIPTVSMYWHTHDMANELAAILFS